MAAALAFDKYPFLKELGLQADNVGCFDGEWFASGDAFTTISPTTGEPIARIKAGTKDDYERLLSKMTDAKKQWQATPAPVRGEIVRSIGEKLRKKKHALASLISLEMGKILSEALGEVQEFIDVCDYAAGLSRMLNGVVIPSERAGHVIQEHWHPLGIVGIITAFNFPCAVYGWNISISLICGNVNIWKGATSTSLVTLATTRVVAEALTEHNIPGAVASTIVGAGRAIGELFLADKRLALVSFTGSTSVGTRIATAVHSRFGRTILELGGNNAIIVLDDANLDLALRSTVFAAIGTAGQRCTSVRRLILHESIYDKFLERLLAAYKTVRIGDPLAEGTLMGPVHTAAAVKEFEEGIAEAQKQGAKLLAGGHAMKDRAGFFVEPTILAWDNANASILKTELFCPILHVLKCKSVEEAIEINNSVPQGLSSSLFTNDMRKVYLWTSHAGSDCGLVNVNAPTNGAEIGGAFGGEKETGGGRESGSDSWKQYMRRATCTINYSSALPLAQGIRFEA